MDAKDPALYQTIAEKDLLAKELRYHHKYYTDYTQGFGQLSQEEKKLAQSKKKRQCKGLFK